MCLSVWQTICLYFSLIKPSIIEPTSINGSRRATENSTLKKVNKQTQHTRNAWPRTQHWKTTIAQGGIRDPNSHDGSTNTRKQKNSESSGLNIFWKVNLLYLINRGLHSVGNMKQKNKEIRSRRLDISEDKTNEKRENALIKKPRKMQNGDFYRRYKNYNFIHGYYIRLIRDLQCGVSRN